MDGRQRSMDGRTPDYGGRLPARPAGTATVPVPGLRLSAGVRPPNLRTPTSVWDDAGDLTLYPREIAAITNEFTHPYGKFQPSPLAYPTRVAR